MAGCGYWGEKYLAKLLDSPDFELVGIAETRPETIVRLQNAYPDLPVSPRLVELCERVKPRAAFLVTPPETRYAQAAYLLSSDIPVLAEKPLTHRAATSLRLLELAAEKGKVLFPALIYAYHPLLQFLTPEKLNALVGEVRFGSFTRTALGPVREKVSPLWDLTIHDLTILIKLLGETPEKVRARPAAPGCSMLQLGYKGGKVFNLFSSWASPARERRMAIAGEKGALVYDEVNFPRQLSFYPGGGENFKTTPQILEFPYFEPLAALLENFARQIADSAIPALDFYGKILDILSRSIVKKGF